MFTPGEIFPQPGGLEWGRTGEAASFTQEIEPNAQPAELFRLHLWSKNVVVVINCTTNTRRFLKLVCCESDLGIWILCDLFVVHSAPFLPLPFSVHHLLPFLPSLPPNPTPSYPANSILSRPPQQSSGFSASRLTTKDHAEPFWFTSSGDKSAASSLELSLSPFPESPRWPSGLRRPPRERKVRCLNLACDGIFPGRVIPVT